MAPCFVYGTLQRGFHNHRVLLGGAAASRFLGRGRTVAPLPLFTDRYFVPYLVDLPRAAARRAGAHRVDGELWDVSRETLALLDDLEGVSASRYLRRRVDVELARGGSDNGDDGATAIAAWTYLLPFPRPGLEDLSGRDFLCSYTLADHRAHYVPPGPRRDPSRLQPWGGFE